MERHAPGYVPTSRDDFDHIPQAFRVVLPPLTNGVILLTKDSSLDVPAGRDGFSVRAGEVRP